MTGPNANQPRPPRRRPRLPRVSYTIAEAARMLGQRPGALRRTVERHAVEEDGELVARLNLGVVARRLKTMGRWAVLVPHGLLEAEE
jgi:hypothetical protein